MKLTSAHEAVVVVAAALSQICVSVMEEKLEDVVRATEVEVKSTTIGMSSVESAVTALWRKVVVGRPALTVAPARKALAFAGLDMRETSTQKIMEGINF